MNHNGLAGLDSGGVVPANDRPGRWPDLGVAIPDLEKHQAHQAEAQRARLVAFDEHGYYVSGDAAMPALLQAGEQLDMDREPPPFAGGQGRSGAEIESLGREALLWLGWLALALLVCGLLGWAWLWLVEA